MKEFKKLVSAFLVVAMVVTLVTITPRCKCGCYNLLRKEDYFNSW